MDQRLVEERDRSHPRTPLPLLHVVMGLVQGRSDVVQVGPTTRTTRTKWGLGLRVPQLNQVEALARIHPLPQNPLLLPRSGVLELKLEPSALL